MNDRSDATDRPAARPTLRSRDRRPLAVFVLASVAAHAGVVILAPGIQSRSVPPPVALEVTIERPKPLPVTISEPLPQPEPLRTPRRAATEPRKIASTPAEIPPVPRILTTPERSAPPMETFTVPPPRPPDPVAPAPPPAPPVKVAVAPPSFNAAYLRNPAPGYPLAARRAGEQGTVMLRVLVRPDGQPDRVELEKSSGSEHLDNAALEAVKGWRFAPARRGDEAIEGWVRVPIVFRLQG